MSLVSPQWLKMWRSLEYGLVLVCLGVAGACNSHAYAGQATPSEVYGIWASSGTMIELSPDGQGGLSGRIIALKHPHWREKDGKGVVGKPKTDLQNPDASLRSRPLIGLEMLSDYRFHKGRWRGRVYLPTDGSSWQSRVFVKNDQLQIHGYLGLPLLGRTEKFSPIAACSENILGMIRTSGLEGTPCDQQLEENE